MGRLSTSQLRAEYGNKCLGTAGVRFSFWNGTPITVHPDTKEAWAALDRIMQAHQYAPKRGETGSYNCRKITGGSGYSLHAFGIAADINWNSGPYRRRPATAPDCAGLWRHGLTDMPCDMVEQIKAIKTNNGVNVFRWGGDYTRNVDAMHWEVVCSRADLRTGINWGSVSAKPFDPADPTMRPTVKRGSPKSFHVENVQTAVGATPVDGAFGAGTERAVKEWQKRQGLPVTGIFDLDDWTRLLKGAPAPKAEPAPKPAPEPAKPEPAKPAQPVPGLSDEEIQFVRDLHSESKKWGARPSSLFHVVRWLREARRVGDASAAASSYMENQKPE